jgi:hypothetical protein
MLGSIPLYVIGKNKKRNSFNTYNKAIATQQAQTASLQLNVHTNGLGLALNF